MLSKVVFFWDRGQSRHEFFPAKKSGLWLADIAGLPIRSLVFGGKQLQLMSWLQIPEKTAFSKWTKSWNQFFERNLLEPSIAISYRLCQIYYKFYSFSRNSVILRGHFACCAVVGILGEYMVKKNLNFYYIWKAKSNNLF